MKNWLVTIFDGEKEESYKVVAINRSCAIMRACNAHYALYGKHAVKTRAAREMF